MRHLGSCVLLLLLLAGQARAQTDEAPPALEVPPGAEPAPSAESAPPPAPVAPPAAPPPPAAAPAPPPSPSNTPVYILPAPNYARPAPPPENFAPRGSPLYPGNSPYGNPAYAQPPSYAQPSYAPPPTYAVPRSYEQPVYTLPPLPPGYTYVPVPTNGGNQTGFPPGELARREQLYRELHRVEMRLDHLQREHIGTGGPITMMIISYGATLLSAGVALSAFESAEQIEDGWNDEDWHDSQLDADDDGEVDEHDEHRFRKTARIAAGVGAATLTLGILSTVRLVKRVAARRTQRVEVTELTQQRQNLRQQLDYGAAIMPGQGAFTVQGKF
jgi:hypothetical protein